MTGMNPLRGRMIDDMTIRDLSPATHRSHLHAVAKFSRHFGRSPEHLDPEDVRAFQVHLVAAGISWPALNQTVCALRFFCGVTLGHAEIPERIPHAREPRKLPVVLSADEVVRFLEAVPSLKTRAALTTAYAAAGLAKRVTVHTLRHSFATHLLESGADIRIIQVPLGHGNLSSAARYTQVSNGLVRRTRSPLDRLRLEVAPPA